MMNSGKDGTLYIVATPIGNLADITYRAVETLTAVDLIAAEDTRHSRVLLQQYGIKTPMIPLHEHNEASQLQNVLKKIQAGASVALISDAGTPLISDPGYRLVCAANDAGIETVPIPGPSALACMLSVACQPVDRFSFEGFLPSRKSARKKLLGDLANETRTLVFYESSHRILESLGDMRDVFGSQRECSVGRELTKRYESLYRGRLGELVEMLQKDPDASRGEFVVVVQGDATDHEGILDEGKKVMDVLLTELSVSKSAALAARLSGARKKMLYEYGLQQSGQNKAENG
jgi:16S rRNA (cytidine1402-2'-O)-methyltransferase